MKFIKFNQAQAEIFVPGVGPIPFHIDGRTAVTCVELNKDEIKELIVNNGRLYLLGPTVPGGDRPLFFAAQVKNPFIQKPKPQDDDKNASKNNGAPGQGPRNDQ